MDKICIGIYIYSSHERLEATLESLQLNTSQPANVLLLADGPDEAMQIALENYSETVLWGTAVSQGAPVCFNRLLTCTEADLYIFLENGAVVGRGWLDYLLAALAADPAHGLAGPSTNRAWNEQGVFPHGQGTLDAVIQTSETAAARFGTSRQILSPLYSLGDFCYAVKREVVDAIGGADEAYGLGPCWEMDYNIRAARAGFKGVWARGAYVYRPPLATHRRRWESRLFPVNKCLYQDRFCGQRLRGEQNDYKSHCRGDACEHFAPPELIQTKIPLPPDAKEESQKVQKQKNREKTAVLNHQPQFNLQYSQSEPPLISCIMPTRDRPEFAMQAVRYFLRQDYPARELIIVDDSLEDWRSLLPDDRRIRFVSVPRNQSIGAKRNRACEIARGDIIAHWDDDDWYAANRLSAQAAPLLSGAADICGLTGTLFFELQKWRFWTCTRPLHRRLFVEDVHGGTLVYRRQVWENLARYPDRSLAEDAVFLRRAVRRRARLHRLPNDKLFVYLRHTNNSWSFPCGRYLDPTGWHQTAEPTWPEEDRAFFANLASPGSMSDVSSFTAARRAAPLVSCIMPTADRRTFASQAIQYFLDQDYSLRELIIVDDGCDAIADLVPDMPNIRYFYQMQKQSVGAKRNFACRQAKGEIIAHWDDDDWMASWRLSYQVEHLLESGADICGLDKVYYLSPDTDQAWQYVYPQNGRSWVAGNTLCYTRAFWQQNPFPDVSVGEDTRFVWSKQPKQICVLPDPSFIVAFIHGRNVSPKRTSGSRWQQLPVEQLLEMCMPS